MTDLTTALLAAYDEHMRGLGAARDGETQQSDGPLLRKHGGFRGFITSPTADLGLRGAELDELITRQRDFFAARGEAVEWKTRGHDLPADLPERLTAAGFVAEAPETVLIGLTAELATPTPVPEGIVLRPVTAPADMRRIAAMESEVWGEDWSWLADDLADRAAADPDGFLVVAAETDTRTPEVVSAAWLMRTPGTEFAGLWGGSTLAAWRGRGIYRSLVAHRARWALDRGIRYLQVDASPDSAPILRRLGMHAVTTTTPYVWTPPTI
ncbi:GNAT family N-acetyltransferase [Kitasatospora cheerisanensis]|uniref:Acetyltransferase n=1 Tax=Kitasatospora cheerisanensis KCTC 2395 TaxID=1348663 RepID=A0A066Z121_9ACTN|nr:GNAT family N-acetyltransferase [Kitasatospora cheerisanensis]KDN84041.1 acetyltransferase [Kitasatospora cheerisanensis KCTC 2395]